MKPFLIALALTLAAAMAVPPTSAVGVPTPGAPLSMIEKVENKSPPKKRSRTQCFDKCNAGCAGNIIGQCEKHCTCVCNAKTPQQAKKCPPPS
jgi:hypothetical protein